jgi:hypothetical protein
MLFACSGPGAGETIARNIEIGYTHAAIVGGLLAASLLLSALRPGKWIVPMVIFGLVLLHPAWTISAISGDCGFLKRDASWFFTAIGTFAVVTQGLLILAHRNAAKELQDNPAGHETTPSNDTDGAIRAGEPPITAKSRKKDRDLSE